MFDSPQHFCSNRLFFRRIFCILLPPGPKWPGAQSIEWYLYCGSQQQYQLRSSPGHHTLAQSQASIQVMWSLSTNQRPEISWGHHLVLAHSGGRHGAINWRNSVFFIGKQYLIRRALCFHLSEDPSFARDLWGSNDRGATRLVRRRHKSWNENLRMCIILQIMRKLHHKIIINTTLLTRCIRRQAPYSMKLKRSV